MSDVNENDESQLQEDDSFPTISSAPSAKALGGQIGPYKLLSVLGEGGFGMVYLAEQVKPIKRRVALKVIKPGMDTKQVIARFEAERQALALLDHPNIAHVFDAGTTEQGRPYFAMEHVKGMSITNYCDHHRLNIKQRLRLFIDVCEAVQYAHQKGIIHRDIKPSNVLVSAHQDKAIPMIIDFGVAKAISQPLTELTLYTEQGQFVGTPEYMSPEQAEMTAEQIDTRSDIYSLGVVLYELLTGTLPFDTKMLREGGITNIRRIIRTDEPKTPSTKLSSLGDNASKIAECRMTDVKTLAKFLQTELEWIPLKAMRKEPDRRYQTASELAQDVRNYLKGDPLLAGPESATYRLKKAIKRNRALVTGIAAVLVVLIAGIIISTVFALGAIKARKAEENQRIAAEHALKEARKAKLISEKQKEDAEQARSEAEQAKKEAVERSEELRIASYYNNIQLADKELDDGEFYSASSRLENCPTDLLGWEWYYLIQMLNSAGPTYHVKGVPVPSYENSQNSISPDGHVAFLLRNRDHRYTISIWDIGTLSEVLVPLGFSRFSIRFAAAFSPDGSRFACGDDEGIVRVWNTMTGSCVATITTYSEKTQPPTPVVGTNLPSSLESLRQQMAKRVLLVALSPDGNRVITHSIDRKTIIWDANTGKEIIVLSDKEKFRSVAYSPDGQRFLTLGSFSPKVLPSSKVWSATGTELLSLSVGIIIAAWSADGQAIAYQRVGYVGICDSTTGGKMTEFPAAFDLAAIAFSPDNKYIVSGDQYGMVRIWEVASGRELLAARRHEGKVQSVIFSRDGSQIISVDRSGTVALWKFPITDVSQARIIDIGVAPNGLRAVAFSPDRRQLAAVDRNTLTILDVVDGAKTKTLDVNAPLSTTCVAFSSDGKYIGAAGRRERRSPTKIWNSDTGAEVLNLEAADAIAFSPDGKHVIVGGRSGFEIWDLANGTKTKAFSRDQDLTMIVSIAFDPEGRCIAVGDVGGTITVLDLETDTKKLTLQATDNFVNVVKFDSGGKRLVSGDDDGMVRIWDAETGESLASCHHGGIIYSVDFSADGRRIVSGGSNGLIHIWDANTGAEVLSLDAQTDVQALGFSHDEQRILAACYDTIMVWDSGSEDKTMVAAYLHERGSFHNREYNFDMAISLLDRALQLEPKDSQTWYQRGLAYFEKREYGKAITDFSTALELVSNNTSFRQKRAETYYRVGKYDLAIADYTKVLEIKPDSFSVMNSLAELYATCTVDEFRNGPKAIELATRSCELTDWTEPLYIDVLAAAYAEAGDFQSAIKWQEKAIALLDKLSFGIRYENESKFKDRLKLYQSSQPFYDTSLFSERNIIIPEEMKTCAENFKKIYTAIKQYEKEKGKLPDWLSDLVPDYLSNEVLFCPNDPNHQAEYSPDPDLPCSYSWQFSAKPIPKEWDPSGKTLYRDWKIHQVKIFGDIVPMVRCEHHGQCLNLAFGGKIWWSPLIWEYMIKPDYRFSPDEILKEK